MRFRVNFADSSFKHSGTNVMKKRVKKKKKEKKKHYPWQAFQDLNPFHDRAQDSENLEKVSSMPHFSSEWPKRTGQHSKIGDKIYDSF